MQTRRQNKISLGRTHSHWNFPARKPPLARPISSFQPASFLQCGPYTSNNAKARESARLNKSLGGCSCLEEGDEEEVYVSPSNVISREQLRRVPKWIFCQDIE